MLRFPPHLNPLPPGARKEKKKMRFSGLRKKRVLAKDAEEEMGQGGALAESAEGEMGRGGEIFELKKRVVLQDFV